MDDVTLARALHVVFVVLWIGGVAFVTTVLLPAVRRLKAPSERVQFFDEIEQRFAFQARISTVVVGLTGFYMVYRFNLGIASGMVRVGGWMPWSVFGGIFILMLSVAEPLVLHRWLLARAQAKPEATFSLVEWLHRALLLLSLITVLGAVAGSHGLLLFE